MAEVQVGTVQIPENAIQQTPDSSSMQRVQIDPSKPEGTSKPAEGERPAWLPEKFKSAEEMAKAYGELEKKQGTGTQAPAPEVKAPVVLPVVTDVQVTDAVQKAGLDLAGLTKEFNEKGGLTDESYTKLQTAGVPKEAVNKYIEGQKAIAERYVSEIAAPLGGVDNLNSILQWAATNISADEVRATNAALRTSDKALAGLVLQQLNAKYTAAMGKDPKLVGGQGTTRQGEGFKDNDEVYRAMKDPRYKASAAYRQEVAAKLDAMNTGAVRVY